MNPIILSVVIVNYNGMQYLQNCLDSLQNQLKTIVHEIIVVDNNSSDNSISFMKTNFPNVKIIESTKNLGFGLGNNLGVDNALGEFILLFNNDTILVQPINEAIQHLQQRADIGVLGIKMLNGEGKYLQSAGNFPNYLNMILFRKLFKTSVEFLSGTFSKKTYEVDWVSGAFMLMRKKTYQTIGGFDADYFMYVEDVDLCKKIEQQNLKRVFYPSLEYIHFVGFTTKKNHQIIDGYQIYIGKHHTKLKKNILNLSLSIGKTLKKLKYD